jgi:hypothetical protein
MLLDAQWVLLAIVLLLLMLLLAFLLWSIAFEERECGVRSFFKCWHQLPAEIFDLFDFNVDEYDDSIHSTSRVFSNRDRRDQTLLARSGGG